MRTDPPVATIKASPARKALLVLVVITQLVMAAELVVLALDARWMHATLTIALMIGFGVSSFAKDRLVRLVPFEVQIATALFLFGTLFLGEVRDFYIKLWWWDLALHTSAGLLLGLLGFIIVYQLNESDVVEVRMRPSFMALFAFFFSVGLGAIWEIFEFAMDQLVGTNMQKPMFDDPSGLMDTMWDLIVDTLGALVMSVGGWAYVKRHRAQRADNWLRRWMDRSPH